MPEELVPRSGEGGVHVGVTGKFGQDPKCPGAPADDQSTHEAGDAPDKGRPEPSFLRADPPERPEPSSRQDADEIPLRHRRREADRREQLGPDRAPGSRRRFRAVDEEVPVPIVTDRPETLEAPEATGQRLGVGVEGPAKPVERAPTPPLGELADHPEVEGELGLVPGILPRTLHELPRGRMGYEARLPEGE